MTDLISYLKYMWEHSMEKDKEREMQIVYTKQI